VIDSSNVSRPAVRACFAVVVTLALSACASLEVQYRENLDIPAQYGRANSAALEREVQAMVDGLATRYRLRCEVCDHIASGRIYRRKDGRHSVVLTANFDPRRSRLYYAVEATEDKSMQKEADRLHHELSSEIRTKFPGVAVSQAGWTWNTVRVSVVNRPMPPADYRLLYAQERLRRLRAEEALLTNDRPVTHAKPESKQKPGESNKEFRKRKEQEEREWAKSLKEQDSGRDQASAKDKDNGKDQAQPVAYSKPEPKQKSGESNEEFRKRKEREEREYAMLLKEQERGRDAASAKDKENGKDRDKDKDTSGMSARAVSIRKPDESDREFRRRQEYEEYQHARRLREEEHARRERDRVLREAESVVALLVKEREDARNAEHMRDYRLARSIVAETALKYGLRSRTSHDASESRGGVLYYAGRRFGTSDELHELTLNMEPADQRLASIAVKTYAEDNVDVQRSMAFEIKDRLVEQLGRERVSFSF
jgi:hypothetical protein